MAVYKDGYRAIDSSTNFKLDEEAIQEFRKKLASNYEDTDEYTGKIRSVLSEVSDISDVGMPDSNGVFDIHEQMDSDLIKLVSNVNNYERENVVRLENSVELLLENLTFKSTATIVTKEGISMGAGAGAQKITTDVTGNDTAGMVAGMVASGVTAKGLNGIEAEANKLAKAPKGIDGVTEEAGNLAEDVGKAGKGLEGAANGAESAAEDAGKVVESGSNFKGQLYNGTRNPDVDFVNGKGKSTLNKHAGKHGYTSPEEYLKDARNFLEKKPTSTIQSFVSNEGTYFRYDTATNEFGIINEYGGISTYFKPENGMAYWLEQIEKYAPK